MLPVEGTLSSVSVLQGVTKWTIKEQFEKPSLQQMQNVCVYNTAGYPYHFKGSSHEKIEIKNKSLNWVIAHG